MKKITALILSLAATAVFAHHGSNGQFNHDIKVEVTGLVTDARFVNPHAYIYFNAVGDNGETQEWRCELRGGSLLKRNGWTEEMFAEGTRITVNGSQARREEFGCYTDTITFADGRVVTRYDVLDPVIEQVVEEVNLAPGTPVLHGHWVASERGGAAPEAAAEFAQSLWPADVPQGRQEFAVSEMGAAAVGDNFDREMNPRFHCQATNLFHDWWFDMHVNKIEQTDDRIVMTYGFMDIERTIHLDMDEHPVGIVPSRAGHSIGWWEGNTLVVDTIGFEEGWLEATRQGIKHSDQMHTVERFDLSDDGEWLVLTYTINDPLYLTQPYTGQLTQGKTLAPYDSYECEDLTEERVEGF